jgi:hypothetical protein
MSLINDALKKTQKLQTQQPAAPGVRTSQSSTRSAGQPGGAMSFERILLLVVALVAVVVGAVAIALLLRPSGNRRVVASIEHPAPTASSPASSTPAASAIPSRPSLPEPAPAKVKIATAVASRPPGFASAPGAQPPVSAPAAPIVISIPIAPPPAAKTAPPQVSPTPSVAPVVTVDLSPTPTSAPVRMDSTPVPAAPPVSLAQIEAAKQRERILAYIDHLRIGGIRLAGDETRVLLNDHVYRLNVVISLELGLRLTGVSTTALTFADENGTVYTKTF